MDKKKLALIHIVKKELGLDDATYRDILHTVTGKDSAKDLDEKEFRQLLNYFVRSPYYRLNPEGLTLRQKLYIQNLSKTLGWEKLHLENFIKKYYHKELEKLSRKEASHLIESLKHIVQRKEKEIKNSSVRKQF
ncbi:MAG: regulatory protein GemA [Candidatus Omnitrophica bacterium]|nr:regulatory protein GemA [Candidatus Omnitrophota bacterium]